MENLFGQIEDLSQAKGIDLQVVIDALKDAMVGAARKYYKTGEELVADYNSETVVRCADARPVTANPRLESWQSVIGGRPIPSIGSVQWFCQCPRRPRHGLHWQCQK